jgi:phage antirepressor YoqD-like protein
MNELIVASVAVRKDAEGRFCLNDLHRAAGGEKRHGPSYWLANQQTKELLVELATTGIPAVATLEGASGGTFVAKELVYAYAMWISAAFHLKVIRAYDALVTAQTTPLIPQSLPEALRLAADLADQKAKVEAELALAAPKVAALDKIAANSKSITITEASKILGVKLNTLTKWLHVNGWVYRSNGSWVAYETQIRSQCLEYKEGHYTDEETGERKYKPYCHVTQKGLVKLAEIFNSGGMAA